MAKNKKECKCHSASGFFLPAGVLIGLGIGFIVNEVPAGVLIGLGSGFILMGITRMFCRCNCKK